MTMTTEQQIQALAASMAAANPDAAEMLAEELAVAARSRKVAGVVHGAVFRFNWMTSQVECRGGILSDYVEGKAPGDGYVEWKADLDDRMTG